MSFFSNTTPIIFFYFKVLNGSGSELIVKIRQINSVPQGSGSATLAEITSSCDCCRAVRRILPWITRYPSLRSLLRVYIVHSVQQ